MNFQIHLSCWANEIDLATAVRVYDDWGYDGVEGPAPSDPVARAELAAEISEKEIPYVAEIATGGDYVPKPGMGVQQHLDDLEHHLEERVSDFAPLIVNVLGGSDRWSLAKMVDFHAQGIELGSRFGHEICWETHRSRPTFNPWVTRDLLVELPEMFLNCDFSHWCCVSERLVMDEEPEILELCAKRCRHFHARVGYEQGPQVPDPRDPFYSNQLEAHNRWWKILLKTARESGLDILTAAPEFGPDGYLQAQPHTQKPVADLQIINQWIAKFLVSNTNSGR